MDKSECRTIVETHFKRLRWLTQTNDWTVDLVYTALSADVLAKVHMKIDYRTAIITIDPDKHENEVMVVNSLRHELIHLMLAAFDVYRDAITPPMKNKEREVEARMSTHACETMVGNIERMLDFGLNPDQFNFTPSQSELQAQELEVHASGSPVLEIVVPGHRPIFQD